MRWPKLQMLARLSVAHDEQQQGQLHDMINMHAATCSKNKATEQRHAESCIVISSLKKRILHVDFLGLLHEQLKQNEATSASGGICLSLQITRFLFADERNAI